MHPWQDLPGHPASLWTSLGTKPHLDPLGTYSNSSAPPLLLAMVFVWSCPELSPPWGDLLLAREQQVCESGSLCLGSLSLCVLTCGARAVACGTVALACHHLRPPFFRLPQLPRDHELKAVRY